MSIKGNNKGNILELDTQLVISKFNSEDNLKLEDKYICESCNERIYILKGVEKCPNCGTIYSNSIDYGAEWRNDIENNGEDKTRCSAPINPMLPQKSYSSGLSLEKFEKRRVYQMLKKVWQWTIIPHHEKSLEARFDNIEYKCKLYNIPSSIIETAKEIYYDINQHIEEEDGIKTRGSSNEGLQAAAVYFAFQDEKQLKTYKEIAHIFNIEGKYVSSGIKKFRAVMEKTEKYSYINREINYNDYIFKYTSILNFTDELTNQAKKLVNEVIKMQILDNNTPNAIVAGCIYFIVIINGVDDITKTKIETVCNISGPTIIRICDKLVLNTELMDVIQ